MKPYYEHGGITIYHGDCREVLPTLGPVDHVITHLTEIRDTGKLRALIDGSSYSPNYDPAEVRDLVNKVHAILQGSAK